MMKNIKNDSLWQILWDYDPNGLVVTDLNFIIQLTNPSFCNMFQMDSEQLVGRKLSSVMDCEDAFSEVWETQKAIRGIEKEYPKYNLYVRKVIFPVPEENLIAAILVDMSHEWQQKQQINQVRTATIEKLNAIVDKQMHVAQEIAGLLGETTAETKVGLIKLIEMIKQDSSS